MISSSSSANSQQSMALAASQVLMMLQAQQRAMKPAPASSVFGGSQISGGLPVSAVGSFPPMAMGGGAESCYTQQQLPNQGLSAEASTLFCGLAPAPVLAPQNVPIQPLALQPCPQAAPVCIAGGASGAVELLTALSQQLQHQLLHQRAHNQHVSTPQDVYGLNTTSVSPVIQQSTTSSHLPSKAPVSVSFTEQPGAKQLQEDECQISAINNQAISQRVAPQSTTAKVVSPSSGLRKPQVVVTEQQQRARDQKCEAKLNSQVAKNVQRLIPGASTICLPESLLVTEKRSGKKQSSADSSESESTFSSAGSGPKQKPCSTKKPTPFKGQLTAVGKKSPQQPYRDYAKRPQPVLNQRSYHQRREQVAKETMRLLHDEMMVNAKKRLCVASVAVNRHFGISHSRFIPTIPLDQPQKTAKGHQH